MVGAVRFELTTLCSQSGMDENLQEQRVFLRGKLLKGEGRKQNHIGIYCIGIKMPAKLFPYIRSVFPILGTVGGNAAL
jgi:hypothetical protein